MATVLINVCYRLYADVVPFRGPWDQLSERGRHWARTNGPHAYMEMMERRLARGQFFRTPCLGWQEFVPDYLGPFRAETRVQEDLNFVLPSMLDEVFPQQRVPIRKPQFRQNVKIQKGAIVYAP
ncbi:MAG: hypothetical protein ACLQGP_02220 [Isosphaeraceae bacterium]